jgi:hypothetical protein
MSSTYNPPFVSNPLQPDPVLQQINDYDPDDVDLNNSDGSTIEASDAPFRPSPDYSPPPPSPPD